MSSHHNILGVPVNASKKDIKRAYFEKAKILHPDVNKSPNAEAEFVKINMAYQALTNPKYIHPPIFKKQRGKNKKTAKNPTKDWIKQRNDHLRREAYKEAKRRQTAASNKAFYRSFTFCIICLIGALIFLIPVKGCDTLLMEDPDNKNRSALIILEVFSVIISGSLFVLFFRYFYLKFFK